MAVPGSDMRRALFTFLEVNHHQASFSLAEDLESSACGALYRQHVYREQEKGHPVGGV